MSKVWTFPLVVLAISSREVGFVASTGPMRIDSAQSWGIRRVPRETRQTFVEERVLRRIAQFDPATVLVTHGTRWRMRRETRARIRAAAAGLGIRTVFLDMDEACDVARCPRSLRATAGRIVDWFPEFSRRLRPTLVERPTPAALRDVRPLLSALTVAYAASAAHVIKFG